MRSSWNGRSRLVEDLEADAKLVDAAYEEFMKVTPADMRPTSEGIQQVLKQVPAVTKDLKLKSTKADDYVDLSLLDQLK